MNDFVAAIYEKYNKAFDADLPSLNTPMSSDKEKVKALISSLSSGSTALFIGLMRKLTIEETEKQKIRFSDLVNNLSLYQEKVSAAIELNHMLYDSEEAKEHDIYCSEIVSVVERYTNKEISEADKSILVYKASDLTDKAKKFVNTVSVLSLGVVNPSIDQPTSLNELIIKLNDSNELPHLIDKLPLGFTMVVLSKAQSKDGKILIVGKSSTYSLVFTVTDTYLMENYFLRDSIDTLYADLFWKKGKMPEVKTGKELLPALNYDGSTEKLISIKNLSPIKVFNILNIVSMLKENWQEQCSNSEPLVVQSSIKVSGDSPSGLPVIPSMTVIDVERNSLELGSLERFGEAVKTMRKSSLVPLFEIEKFDTKFSCILNGEEGIVFESKEECEKKSGIFHVSEQAKFDYGFLGSEREAKYHLAKTARINRRNSLAKKLEDEFKSSFIDIKEYLINQANEAGVMLNILAEGKMRILEKLSDKDIAFIESNGFDKDFSSKNQERHSYNSFQYITNGKYLHIDPRHQKIILNEQRNENYICPISGGVANFFVVAVAKDAFDIAHLIGKSREDLEFNLHVNGLSPSNSGDLHYDPMAGLKYPYKEERFAFALGLSSKGYNQVRKELGLDFIKKQNLIGIFRKKR